MSRTALKSYPGLNLNPHPESKDGKLEATIFGFWVFLMSDLILFGVVFAVYITMIGATAGGPGPKELFDFSSLGAQTLVLLLSSLSAGVATLTLKYDRGVGRLIFWLLVTLVLGLLFLTLELRDFASMIAQGGGPERSGYLSAFFGLVPLHGLHVGMGCLWLLVLLFQIKAFGLLGPVRSRLMRFALFWHFLDLIWVGIFSVVYFGGWIYG